MDTELAHRLVLMESGLDAPGAFAAGPAPGLADCDLMASAFWLEALCARFGLRSKAGALFARTEKANAADPRFADDIARYRYAVTDSLRPARRANAQSISMNSDLKLIQVSGLSHFLDANRNPPRPKMPQNRPLQQFLFDSDKLSDVGKQQRHSPRIISRSNGKMRVG